MSCNGCRVLRRGCAQSCLLRQCLQRFQTPQAQGNVTLFVAKYFGRSNLLSKIAAVSEDQRPDLFESLLFEACGRTINPVGGAVELMRTGNWHLCQKAVQTVLAGGCLKLSSKQISSSRLRDGSDRVMSDEYTVVRSRRSFMEVVKRRSRDEVISAAACFIADGTMNERIEEEEEEGRETTVSYFDFEQPKVLNLFV